MKNAASRLAHMVESNISQLHSLHERGIKFDVTQCGETIIQRGVDDERRDAKQTGQICCAVCIFCSGEVFVEAAG